MITIQLVGDGWYVEFKANVPSNKQPITSDEHAILYANLIVAIEGACDTIDELRKTKAKHVGQDKEQEKTGERDTSMRKHRHARNGSGPTIRGLTAGNSPWMFSNN